VTYGEMYRVVGDLKALKGYLKAIPRDVAPNKDPGIYLAKAEQQLRYLISKYERVKLNLRKEAEACPSRDNICDQDPKGIGKLFVEGNQCQE